MVAVLNSSYDAKVFYDTFSKNYEAVILRNPYYQKLYSFQERVFWNHIPKAANGEKALDIGCGTGIFTKELHDRGYRVVGIDAAPSMVEIAREKLKHLNPNPIITIGVIDDLPFEEGVFDAIVAFGSVVNYAEDAERAIAEMSRVLRNDGIMLFDLENAAIDYELSPIFPLNLPRKSFSETFYWPFFVNGSRFDLRMKAIGVDKVKGLFKANGVSLIKMYGVHILTSLLPGTTRSAMLANPDLHPMERPLYRLLSWLDKLIADKFPFYLLGSNQIVVAKKV